jgi:lipopolysaccharide transport system ATP-binding protein
MMQTVHLDNVSKRFRLGASNEYGRITEAIAGVFKRWVAPDLSLAHAGNGVPNSQIRDGWFWALDGLQLEVQQGEILGIVGKNGAGKSTLLKLLARIITPTTGRVGVRGRVGSLLEVGTGFHPELTGRENVYLNGSILGMSRRDIKARFDQIVDFAEIGPFLDTPVKRYSSGMAVRLAFSVAAYLEPDVLIVDEVLAVGDQAFQQKCILKAKELGEQGRTVLLVSHNLASVANLCTRAVYLREGRLILDSSP